MTPRIGTRYHAEVATWRDGIQEREGVCIAVLADWWKHTDGAREDAAVLEDGTAQWVVPASTLQEVTT